VTLGTCVKLNQIYASCRCRHLNILKNSTIAGVSWVQERSNPCQFWNDSLQQLQILNAEFNCDIRDAGDIASRLSKTRYEPLADGISNPRHHNRNVPGRLLCCLNARRCPGDEDIDFLVNQFTRQLWKLIVLSVGKAPVNNNA